MKLIRIFFISVLLLFGACSRPEAPKPPPPEPKELPVVYHQVHFKGETLALIAKWYTGNPKNWKAIAEINPDMNPDRILLEEVIRIPKSIAVKDKAYTLKEFRKLQGSSRSPAREEPAKSGETGAAPQPGQSEGRAGTLPEDTQYPSKYDGSSSPYPSDPAAEKRREIQEKTRYELLQEMLGGEKGE